MTGYKVTSVFLVFILIAGLTGVAFAEYGDDNSARQSSYDNETKNNSVDDSQNYTQLDNQNKTGEESQSEYQSLNENNQTNQNENHQDNQDENQTDHEENQTSHEDMEELDNEHNNDKATHQEDQQTSNDIINAIDNKTVSTIVNIGEKSQETKSIDDNIEAHTENSTNDSVSVTVDSKTESGPKVIIFNLNSTTIDVSSVKYLHITYDGQSISPAADINSVLHAKSTDNPSYAIIITQNGAQVLVSIPHFSNHTITLSSISKVMSSIPPVPEFPYVASVFLVSIASLIFVYRIKINFKYAV